MLHRVQEIVLERREGKLQQTAPQHPSVKRRSLASRDEDSLFQIFRELVHFNADTNLPLNRAQRMQQKIEWVPLLQDKTARGKIKQLKICKLESIETDLANDEYLSVPVFLALCVAHPAMLNVLFLFENRTCFTLRAGWDAHPLYVVREISKRDRVYVIEAEHATCELLEQLQSQYLPLDRADGQGRCLKAVSSYKVSELQQMCAKLQLSCVGTKAELYERLVQHLGV